MPPKVLAEIEDLESREDFDNPRYMELLLSHYYIKHVIRFPFDEWPEPLHRTFKHLNHEVYTTMQGPSEFGIRGKLETWDRNKDLDKIYVPTLVIGATHDTMDPKHMEWVASQLKNGKFLLCPDGSHLASYDDQVVYFSGLIDFIKAVDNKM